MFIFSHFPFIVILMEKKQSRKQSEAKFSFVGYPDEGGVKNVNGRLGAKEGPTKFLTYFQKLKGKWPLQERMLQSEIVPVGSDLETNYETAMRVSSEFLLEMDAKRDVLLAVGGGHDNAYPWLHAIEACLPIKTRIGCINLDAHFDLRDWTPVMTSGSPFRRLIEEGVIEGKNLVEFGIQAHCNGPELWEFAKQNKVKIVGFESLRNGKAVSAFARELKSLRARCDIVVISLDLDALSFAFCPGVSAPQAEGFTASEVFQMLEIAGSDKKVTSLGIFELAPALDREDLTSRLAAQAAWHFLDAKLK
jgi:formiminoglutamase